MGNSIEQARVALAERLRVRQEEIEDAILTRVYAIDGGEGRGDHEWLAGVRATVSTAVEHALVLIEGGVESAPLPPVLLLAQTRLAARSGISLDTVLRRYFAGFTLIGDFIVQESAGIDLRERWLKKLLREQAAAFDGLLLALSEEYRREANLRPDTPEARRVARVKRLLEGELTDASELNYPLELHHNGVIAAGPGAQEALKLLAAGLDRLILAVEPADEVIWAWLGGRQPVSSDSIASTVRGRLSPQVTMALGEGGRRASGWRLTHRQAFAAFRVARETDEQVVRYADISLLASTLADDVLADYLRQRIYPSLVDASSGGTAIRDTLRAYLQTGRNVTSAAAVLNISRRTVSNRLRALEESLGEPLDARVAEVEVALNLLDFEERRALPQAERLTLSNHSK
ncbi:MAG TPA: helix-turn-helix domain-containing protein [Solirubrobacterales bacterium]|nr:helix-turn-helix domain-containing protein [Solirubrobacterales bacterium]